MSSVRKESYWCPRRRVLWEKRHQDQLDALVYANASVRYALSTSATSAHVPQQTEPEVIKEEPLPERGIIL